MYLPSLRRPVDSCKRVQLVVGLVFSPYLASKVGKSKWSREVGHLGRGVGLLHRESLLLHRSPAGTTSNDTTPVSVFMFCG